MPKNEHCAQREFAIPLKPCCILFAQEYDEFLKAHGFEWSDFG